MLRPALTLIWKDFRHHFLGVAGGLVVLFMGWLASVSFALEHDDASLLTAGVNAVYWFGGPYFATIVVRRWFIIEREDRSHEFLLTLPLRDGTRFWIRYAVAIGISVLACESAVVAITILSVRQELMPISWLLAIGVQVAAYVWAWSAIATLAAHVGRYRWPMWGVLFIVVASLGDWAGVEAFQVLGWQAVLAQPVVITRAAFPWSGLAVTTLWAAGATLAAFVLCTWRQGLWVDRAWEPLTPGRRAAVAGFIATSVMVGDLVSTWKDDTPPWDGIRSVSPCIRTAAPAGSNPGAVATHLAAILDGWGATPGPWPVLIVLREAAIQEEPPPSRGSIPIVIGDAETPRDALVRALDRSLSAHLDRDDWWVVGIAERHGGRDLDPVVVQRLSWAVLVGVAPVELLDRAALEARLGRHVAGAVAALGTLCGDDPESTTFQAEFTRRLGAVPAARHPIEGSVARGTEFGVGVRLDWTLSAAPAATWLEWVPLPPLRHLPDPASVPSRSAITIGTGSARTRLDPRANVMARFVSDVPGVGQVASSWQELPP